MEIKRYTVTSKVTAEAQHISAVERLKKAREFKTKS